MKVLVTGASGFIGNSVALALVASGYEVTAVLRRPCDTLNAKVQQIILPRLDECDFSTLSLTGYDTVIHAAAVCSSESASAKSIMKANVDLTLGLAELSSLYGVRRFIFLSSIKVFGELSPVGKPFGTGSPENPSDIYALSKLKAENGIKEALKNSETQYVIIRSPMVYGPGGKGNFNALVSLASTKIPLPFGGVKNQRSMVFIENLVSFIKKAMIHPNAGDNTFLVSDLEDLSTTQLISIVRHKLSLSPRLIYLPSAWIYLVAGFLKKRAIADRLFGSLQIDVSDTCTKLDWYPPYSPEQGISLTIKGTAK